MPEATTLETTPPTARPALGRSDAEIDVDYVGDELWAVQFVPPNRRQEAR